MCVWIHVNVHVCTTIEVIKRHIGKKKSMNKKFLLLLLKEIDQKLNFES